MTVEDDMTDPFGAEPVHVQCSECMQMVVSGQHFCWGTYPA